MSKLKESIPRSLIKNGGVNVCGTMEYWHTTWHEEDGAEWAIAKAQINCVCSHIVLIIIISYIFP